MALANTLSEFVCELSLRALAPEVVTQAKTLVLDALACTIAGAGSASASTAMAVVNPPRAEAAATIVVDGARADAASAALVNGAMLRSLDLMDVYVTLDVSHPSEVVPAALACAEAGLASGRDFLEGAIAGMALHQLLTDYIALHAHGLHHAGQAAWTVPLVAGRLLARSAGTASRATTAARALTITAHRLLVPESFARGQLTNLKALAYPLLAREGIEALRLAQAGLVGRDSACEDTVELLAERFGMRIKVGDLEPKVPADLSGITLKKYPAQYALQPLIAAACRAHALGFGAARGVEKVVVHASRRTVERTADPAKYAPNGPEAADHSLPFCIAVALMDGEFSTAALQSQRWAEPETRALMTRIEASPIGTGTGYQIGSQRMELRFQDGTVESLPCHYPPDGDTPYSIAERKLRKASEGLVDAEQILNLVMNLEDEPDLRRLGKALSSRHPVRGLVLRRHR